MIIFISYCNNVLKCNYGADIIKYLIFQDRKTEKGEKTLKVFMIMHCHQKYRSNRPKKRD